MKLMDRKDTLKRKGIDTKQIREQKIAENPPHRRAAGTVRRLQHRVRHHLVPLVE